MMTDFVTLWLGGFCTGFAMAGYLFNRKRRVEMTFEWRRSFNHENINQPPSGPPPLRLRRSEPDEQFIRMDESPIQRSNGSGGPTTPKPGIIPKPQFPPPEAQ